MPYAANDIPTHSHRQLSGQAVVRLNGKDHNIGLWNTAGGRQEYYRLIGEWLAGGRQLAVAQLWRPGSGAPHLLRDDRSRHNPPLSMNSDRGISFPASPSFA